MGILRVTFVICLWAAGGALGWLIGADWTDELTQLSLALLGLDLARRIAETIWSKRALRKTLHAYLTTFGPLPADSWLRTQINARVGGWVAQQAASIGGADAGTIFGQVAGALLAEHAAFCHMETMTPVQAALYQRIRRLAAHDSLYFLTIFLAAWIGAIAFVHYSIIELSKPLKTG